MLAEYVGASKAFDPNDLKFNDKGARPQALHVEGGYNFTMKEVLHTVFAGLDLTSQALALYLPKQSYFMGYSVELIKHTYLGIEYRHYINYEWGDTAGSTGRTVLANSVNGRHDNILIVDFGLYF